MTPRPKHPGTGDWLRYLDGAAGEGVEMERHLAACSSCREEVAFLRGIEGARRVPRWAAPGARARTSARTLPGGASVPPPPRRAAAVAWPPSDVRGAGLLETGGARMVSHSTPEADLGVLAVPPRGNGPWRIEGRIWLARPATGSIRIVLVHDDHVFAARETEDGGRFTLEEVLPPGWTLEVHLPGGRTLLVKDPHA